MAPALRLLRFCQRQWFLTALSVVLVIGLNAGPQSAALAEAFPRRTLIAAILLVTTLPVAFGQMATVAGARRAIALAFMLSTIAGPLLGYVASLFLSPGLGAGMFLALASPCTMASAAVWTRRGEGNDAVALSVTLLTSLACFVVLPGWAWLLIDGGVPINALELTLTLLACVAVPVAVTQFARRWEVVAAWADRTKSWLNLAGQGGVLILVLLGAVDAGARTSETSQVIDAGAWLVIGGLSLVTHTVLLLSGWWLAQRSGLAYAEAVAVAIAGSQKTLAVGVGVAAEFGPLALFPMIAYHVVQLIIDTLFVDRIRSRSQA